MGIAFAVVYFAVLGIAVLVVVFIAHKLSIDFPHARRRTAGELAAFVFGLLAMAATTLLVAWSIPAQSGEFNQLGERALLTLLMPGFLGGIAAAVSRSRFQITPTSNGLLIANRAGLGAMNATWLIPIVVWQDPQRFL